MAVTQFFNRTPKSLTLINGAPNYEELPNFEKPTGIIRLSVYSPDGTKFAYVTPLAVTIINPDDGSKISTIEINNAIEVTFSPRGNFILTWQRPQKEESSGNFAPNLKVWNANTGEFIESFVQKQQGDWSVQYTFDEKYCARQAHSGLIQFFQSDNLKTVKFKLEVDNMDKFSLSPGQNYSIAIFIPEKSGRPAQVRVYQVPNFQNPVSQKTFFKAERLQMKWNKLGTALLALSSTEVDQSGKSYYGETNLYLLGIAGKYDSRIQLDQEGSIHDFAWSPNSREFGVTYGYMPSKTTIFDSRGNVIHSFPVSSRNTLMFSPGGRLILVGGFGNLQGQIDIYDRQKQFSKVCTIEAPNTSYCEWSPDGRYLLTATTAPRLRVDNGVKIWHMTGKLIFAKDYEELNSVTWRPQDSAEFPQMRTSLSPAPESHPSAANATLNKPASSKPAGAYRPPHARTSAGGSSAPTPLFQRLIDKSNGLTGNGGAATQKYVPGAAPAAAPADANNVNKTASKNKKKREARKAKEGESSSSPRTSPAPPTNAPSAPASSAAPALPEDKKIRSLAKKLRAIEELKQRQTNGDKLEDTQIQKINNEANVRKELEALGWVGSN